MSTSERVIALDTQLLVLLAVGLTSPDIISKHKKTRSFDISDFELLTGLIAGRSLLLLPDIITEASNHLLWHKPPERDTVCEMLRTLVAAHQEVYIESKSACDRPEYLRLGIADAALLLATGRRSTLLTADVALHLAAEDAGLSTVNFNHERERYGLV